MKSVVIKFSLGCDFWIIVLVTPPSIKSMQSEIILNETKATPYISGAIILARIICIKKEKPWIETLSRKLHLKPLIILLVLITEINFIPVNKI